MNSFEAYPLKFREIFKQTVWGGGRLCSLLGKEIPPENKTGESWEIADHDLDTSVVANGRFAGKRTLRNLCEQFPVDILGTALTEKYRDRFPLLLKFIDANADLSVQVHPDDEYARENENGGLGKTEAWYIISAERGSRLILGLTPGTTRETFRELLEAGRVEECLNNVPVKPGDVAFIPAGTVHAIGAGIVLAEIQQNSDITYRAYDWGRVGLDGGPRELHTEKALDVINFAADPAQHLTHLTGAERETIAKCANFTAEAITLTEKSIALQVSPERFEILCVVEGSGEFTWDSGEFDLTAGTSLLLPATLGGYKLSARRDLRVLHVTPG